MVLAPLNRSVALVAHCGRSMTREAPRVNVPACAGTDSEVLGSARAGFRAKIMSR
jgi:hypothetical protein